MSPVKSLIFIISLFLIIQSAFAQPSNTKIDSIIHLITPLTYRQHFDSIHSQSGMYRKVTETSSQSSDHDACRDYVFRTLKQYLGEENVYLQPFYQDNYYGLANVIGMKHGHDPAKGIIMIGAHYDSNNNREENEQGCSPGANDNGTGIAAVLEIARVLSGISTEYTIIIAAWDLEEEYTYGYATGSNHWYNECTYKMKASRRNNKKLADKIARDRILAYINFDMFGNPGDSLEGKPLLWACSGNLSQKNFVDEYVSVVNSYIPEIKAINYGELIYSDHYTFADREIPSVENLESEYDKDPFYHTCSDNTDNCRNIDYNFASNITRGGLAFLLEKALLTSEINATSDQIKVP
jgi:hypothetical protein